LGRRRRARESALQMLFQVDLTGEPVGSVFAEFWKGQSAETEVRDFAESLVRGVLKHRETLDGAVAASAQHWRVERMAVVDRNVLRLAVYEILFHEETPPPVVIDEAIEVAKKYGSAESGSFINGILDDVRLRRDRGGLRRPVEPDANT
jgi:N utilization substance protein B